MLQNEFKAQSYKFRIKKMNAIELLALRTTLDFENIEKLQATYNNMLERVEVNIKDDKWIQVKQGDDYYPAGIEDNLELIELIVKEFLNYIKAVFLKSNESKKAQD